MIQFWEQPVQLGSLVFKAMVGTWKKKKRKRKRNEKKKEKKRRLFGPKSAHGLYHFSIQTHSCGLSCNSFTPYKHITNSYLSLSLRPRTLGSEAAGWNALWSVRDHSQFSHSSIRFASHSNLLFPFSFLNYSMWLILNSCSMFGSRESSAQKMKIKNKKSHL